MSTYNGAEYLEEQLRSILNQEDVDVRVLIRDDGSVDGTIAILKEYERIPNVRIIYGSNIGAAKSFLELIKVCDGTPYYSFADQDDIWLPNKLSIAITALNDNRAVLYHGLAGRVDKHLNKLPDLQYYPKDSFGASLLTSATGCTMVLTHDFIEILKTHVPDKISMHDAWVYRVAFALGLKVFYDPESYMLYRQHDHNVSGGQMNVIEKVKMLKKNKGLKLNLAIEINRLFYNFMDYPHKAILYDFISYRESFRSKFKTIFSRQYNVNDIKTNLLNKFLFLINFI